MSKTANNFKGSVYCQNEELAEIIFDTMLQKGYAACMSSTVITSPHGEEHVKRVDILERHGSTDRPILVTSWEDLVGCASDNYFIRVDVEGESARIYSKAPEPEFKIYLPTNSFTSNTIERTEKLLTGHGFNVILASVK